MLSIYMKLKMDENDLYIYQHLAWSWLLSELLQEQFSQKKKSHQAPDSRGLETQRWRNFMQIPAATKSQTAPKPNSNVSEPTSSGDLLSLLEDGGQGNDKNMKL